MEPLSLALEACQKLKLTTPQDFHYGNAFPDYRAENGKVVKALKSVIGSVAGTQGLEAAFPELADASEWVGDRLDDLFEQIDLSLDAAKAELNTPEGPQQTAWHPSLGSAPEPTAGQVAGEQAQRSGRGSSFLATADVLQTERPQNAFQPPADNSAAPWEPRFAHWPGDKGTGEWWGGVESVLQSLTYQPWQLQPTGPSPEPQALEDTPFCFVSTPEQLDELAAALAAAKEFAVDLENHSYRSYQGFLCLLQLSTRSADYVVDALSLRAEIGPVLGPFFADPKVLKVLHGADSDVLWLQRCFGISLCNLFDTGQAARALGKRPGLANVLSEYFDFEADKRLQLADWRVRPLSSEMLTYARCDTHFLLPLKDKQLAELNALPPVTLPADILARAPPASAPDGDNNPQGALSPGHSRVLDVLERSRKLCLQTYSKECFTGEGMGDMLERSGKLWSPEQQAAAIGLGEWRDATARSQDESLGYVMPRRLLLKLCQQLPSSLPELQALLGSEGGLVRQHAATVLSVIEAAKLSAAGASSNPSTPSSAVPARAASRAAASPSGAQEPATSGQAVGGDAEQQQGREGGELPAASGSGGGELLPAGQQAEGGGREAEKEGGERGERGQGEEALKPRVLQAKPIKRNVGGGLFGGRKKPLLGLLSVRTKRKAGSGVGGVVGGGKHPPGASFGPLGNGAVAGAAEVEGGAPRGQVANLFSVTGSVLDETVIAQQAANAELRREGTSPAAGDGEGEGMEGQSPGRVEGSMGALERGEGEGGLPQGKGQAAPGSFGGLEEDFLSFSSQPKSIHDRIRKVEAQQGSKRRKVVQGGGEGRWTKGASGQGREEREEGEAWGEEEGAKRHQAGGNRFASLIADKGQKTGGREGEASVGEEGPALVPIRQAYPQHKKQRREEGDRGQAGEQPAPQPKSRAQKASAPATPAKISPYDYGAARAANPELDPAGLLGVTRQRQGGRGNREGSGGRGGGRGRGRGGKEKEPRRPSFFSVGEGGQIKAGGSSKTMPRTGNKRMTFS